MNSLQTIFGVMGGGAGEKGALEFFVAILFSVGIGIFYIFLYRFYFEKDEPLEESLHKSFILIAPTVTAIFWTIQYSLPLSLGLLGALSFVRFRTPIKRSEDIAFILIIIASALASAVYRFETALIFAGVLLAVVLVKKFINKKGILMKQKAVALFISFRGDDGGGESQANKIEAIIGSKVQNAFKLINISSFENQRVYHYQISGHKSAKDIEDIVLSVNKNLNPERVEVFNN